MIEIKHLRLLSAVKASGSISAAARSLGYSQSAVTQQIQNLERQLRTPVIIRASSGVLLTEAGEVIVRHAALVLPAMAMAEAEIDAVAGLRSGRVRIASFPSAASTIIPRSLGAVSRQFPGVSFTLVEAEPPRALELLRRGECDIAIIFEHVTFGQNLPPRFPLRGEETALPLIDERMHIAVAASHPLAGRDSIGLVEMRDSRWIAGCPECRGNLHDSCALWGFEADVAFETDDYRALQGLVAAGLGVALVSDLMLGAARQEPQLRIKSLLPESHRMVSAVSTASLRRVPGVTQTLSELASTAREIAAEVDA